MKKGDKCEYCKGTLVVKKLYKKGFDMLYCKECDVYFSLD